MNPVIFVEVVVFLVLNFLDFRTTVKGVGSFGLRENNPFAKWFMKLFGIKRGMFLLKIFTILPLLLMAFLSPNPEWLLLFMIGFICFVVGTNYWQLSKSTCGRDTK